MTQTAAIAAKPAGDDALRGEGVSEANPSPDPNVSKARLIEMATAVPAKIAAQETADFEASTA
jgi:hypothetical protein